MIIQKRAGSIVIGECSMRLLTFRQLKLLSVVSVRPADSHTGGLAMTSFPLFIVENENGMTSKAGISLVSGCHGTTKNIGTRPHVPQLSSIQNSIFDKLGFSCRVLAGWAV